MSKHSVVSATHEAGLGSFKSYTVGFICSVTLTLVAFTLVSTNLFTGGAIIVIILLLALVQLAVQAIFFLHLGRDSSQRWNLTVFVFMLIIVIILVTGTLWIMRSLGYNHEHRSPGKINTDIVRDEGYKK